MKFSKFNQSFIRSTSYVILSILIPLNVLAIDFKDADDIPLWAEDSIEAVQDASIMTGYGDGTFRPDESINRAQALTIIFRTKNINTDVYKNESATKFKDINSRAWFRNSVAGAVKKGWAKGDPDGNFRPERILNRAEWSTLLMRAFDLKADEREAPTFRDVPSSIWFAESVFAMHNHNLIRYPKAMNFDPTREVTRAEAAWTMAQILNKPSLMGTAAQPNSYEGYRIGINRTVAIKPRDLNVDKQGVEETRKDLTFTTFRDNEISTVYRGSDWESMGSIKITNPFDTEVELNSMELALRFDKSVGPNQNFMVQIANNQFAGEKEFGRTGRIMFVLKDTKIRANDAITVKVNLKPISEKSFFSKTGTGKISLHDADATMWTESTRDGGSYTVSRFTPVTFENRDLKEFTFIPKYQE
jgi:hypothetical protein